MISDFDTNSNFTGINGTLNSVIIKSKEVSNSKVSQSPLKGIKETESSPKTLI